MSESQVQKLDLALAYIVKYIDQSCQPFVEKVKFPNKARKTLRETFNAMNEAAVDAKISQLQNVPLGNSEYIVEYLCKIVGLIG